MSSIDIEKIISPYESCVNKNISELTMLETISLIIYMTKKYSENSDEKSFMIKKYYDESIEQIKEQNRKGWPKIISLKNDVYMRTDGIVGGAHENTNNMLVLLIRLIHLENEKNTSRSETSKKILDYNISDVRKGNVRTIKTIELSELLKKYMNYYNSVYSDPTRFENILGNKIINHL